MVLGHTKCGAVTAAVQSGEAPGHIDSIVKAIQPAVKASAGQPGDAVLNAIKANVHLTVDQIRQSKPTLADMAKDNKIKVIGGLYHLDSGLVEWL